ncbi:hypothetical protein INR49_019353, partial [Caranx melampygus]
MDGGVDTGDRGEVRVRGAAEEALHQCRLIQNLVDISSSSLRALRTRCTATNDLTRQEIRTLEGEADPSTCGHSCSGSRRCQRGSDLQLWTDTRGWRTGCWADLTPQFIQ